MNILNKYTLESLKKNRTRTIVTVIGIVLSVAMFTATTEAVTSIMNMMRDYYAEKYGTCHTVYREAYYKDGDAVLSDGRIKETAVLQHIGHSYINSRNKDKPYIFVAGVSENYSDLVSVRLTKGRMPKKADEIVLPEHLLSFAAEKYDVGDKILLDVGKRYVGEKFLPQHENLEEGEKLADTEKMTFTVVGLMERPSTLTEELYDPGFTAYTVQRSGNYPRDIYVKMNNMRSTYKISNELEKSKLPQRTANEDSAEYSDTRIFMPNSSLLEVYNINETEQMSTFSILMSMAVVLLAVIMVGSVMLIHNAFSISVGERIKQYGILKSVGATKKQIRQSVLFEAFLLCAAAVPVGVISGIIGISLTFRYLMQDFAKVLGEDVITISGNIKITPDFWAILAAVAISFLTALISAYIPARKVVKKSPIEAIRQSETVSVKAKKLRTSRLSYKLFGLEGMLADKYYKRSKKKYRTVVLSLFVSVVLFISASAMCDYMVKNVQMEYGEVPKSDVDAGYSNLSEESIKKICNVLDATKEVDEYAFVHDDLADAVIPNELFNREYAYWEIKEYQLHGAYTSPVQGEFVPDMFVRFKFIEDEKFKAFLKEKHLDEEDFFNPNEPAALYYDNCLVQYNENGRYYHKNVPSLNIKKLPKAVTMFVAKNNIYGFAQGTIRLDGSEYYVGLDPDFETGEEYDDTKAFNVKEVSDRLTVRLMMNVTKEDLPMYFGVRGGEDFVLYFPQSMAKAVRPGFKLGSTEGNIYTWFFIKTKEHAKVAALLKQTDMGIGNYESRSRFVLDNTESMEREISMAKILNVLSTGFIALISLICAANAFNTISTSIYLRRREFAMLRSAGMSRKGFSKMMIFESLLYGVQSILFGVPVSCGVCYILFRTSLDGGNDLGFYVPWDSVLIAVFSVFAVILAGMIYSMHKLQKENTADALKNDNI